MTKTIQRLPEVTDKATAVANVFSYNDALNNSAALEPKVRADLLRTVSMARSWFAVERGGDWLVAPAKYAGFSGMTPSYYADNRVVGISGTQGEVALKRIAGNKTVVQTHPAFLALKALAERFDRVPSALAYVCILHEELKGEQVMSLPVLEAKAIEALTSFAATLSSEGRAVLKQQVATL